MSDHIGIDNPAFYGRLRQSPFAAPVAAKPVRPTARKSGDVRPIAAPTRPRPVAPVAVRSRLAQTPRPIVRPQPVVVKPVQPVTLVQPVAEQMPLPVKPQRPAAQRVERRRNRRQSKPQMALMALAGIVFVVGLTVSFSTLQTNHSVKNQVDALSKTADNSGAGDGSSVSEDKPSSSAVAGYSTSPLSPKLLKISGLGVNARIRPLGVTPKGDLQAPSNIHDAGWYNASARPGDSAGNGAILMDGHVHGPTMPGVFAKLKKMSAGEIIQVVRGDNKVYNYKVLKIENFESTKLDMAKMLTSVVPGKAGLNIITCGGSYDKTTGHYEERTVAFAVEV